MTLDIRKLRYLLAAILALVVGVGVYAFTASNSVPDTKAGSGTGTITGYAVTNVAYNLGATPTDIASVTFHLDATAGTVKVQLVSGGTWYSCANTSGTDWSCDTTVGTQATVQPADNLTVVATS